MEVKNLLSSLVEGTHITSDRRAVGPTVVKCAATRL